MERGASVLPGVISTSSHYVTQWLASLNVGAAGDGVSVSHSETDHHLPTKLTTSTSPSKLATTTSTSPPKLIAGVDSDGEVSEYGSSCRTTSLIQCIKAAADNVEAWYRPGGDDTDMLNNTLSSESSHTTITTATPHLYHPVTTITTTPHLYHPVTTITTTPHLYHPEATVTTATPATFRVSPPLDTDSSDDLPTPRPTPTPYEDVNFLAARTNQRSKVTKESLTLPLQQRPANEFPSTKETLFVDAESPSHTTWRNHRVCHQRLSLLPPRARHLVDNNTASFCDSFESVGSSRREVVARARPVVPPLDLRSIVSSSGDEGEERKMNDSFEMIQAYQDVLNKMIEERAEANLDMDELKLKACTHRAYGENGYESEDGQDTSSLRHLLDMMNRLIYKLEESEEDGGGTRLVCECEEELGEVVRMYDQVVPLIHTQETGTCREAVEEVRQKLRHIKVKMNKSPTSSGDRRRNRQVLCDGPMPGGPGTHMASQKATTSSTYLHLPDRDCDSGFMGSENCLVNAGHHPVPSLERHSSMSTPSHSPEGPPLPRPLASETVADIPRVTPREEEPVRETVPPDRSHQTTRETRVKSRKTRRQRSYSLETTNRKLQHLASEVSELKKAVVTSDRHRVKGGHARSLTNLWEYSDTDTDEEVGGGVQRGDDPIPQRCLHQQPMCDPSNTHRLCSTWKSASNHHIPKSTPVTNVFTSMEVETGAEQAKLYKKPNLTATGHLKSYSSPQISYLLTPTSQESLRAKLSKCFLIVEEIRSNHDQVLIELENMNSRFGGLNYSPKQ